MSQAGLSVEFGQRRPSYGLQQLRSPWTLTDPLSEDLIGPLHVLGGITDSDSEVEMVEDDGDKSSHTLPCIDDDYRAKIIRIYTNG